MHVIDDDVHWCDWSGQPDLHIACADDWTTPGWGDYDTTNSEVFVTDDNRFYTFETSQVTCPACINMITAHGG